MMMRYPYVKQMLLAVVWYCLLSAGKFVRFVYIFALRIGYIIIRLSTQYELATSDVGCKELSLTLTRGTQTGCMDDSPTCTGYARKPGHNGLTAET